VPEKKYPLIKDSINPLFWPAVVGFGFGYGFLRVGGKLEEIWSRAKGVILKPKSEDLYRTAVHEAGHAVLLFLCPSNERIKRATINPVGSYLGCVFSKHTRPNSNLEELKNKIIILFGGRAAEQEIFNNFDTGSVSDLAKASNIARDIVTQYGMSEEIGPVQIPIYHTNSSFFENEKEKINNTVKTILEECLQKARQILNENKTILEAVAQALMQKRTLSHDQIEKIITKMRSSVSLENKPT
jgi:cell division protease FtsH